MEGILTTLWRSAALVTVVVVLGAFALAWVRWRFPSLTTRAVTTLIVLGAAPTSWWMVNYLVDPAIRAAHSHGSWIHPSPIFFIAPAILGLAAGALYSRHLHEKAGGRVA